MGHFFACDASPELRCRHRPHGEGPHLLRLQVGAAGVEQVLLPGAAAAGHQGQLHQPRCGVCGRAKGTSPPLLRVPQPSHNTAFPAKMAPGVVVTYPWPLARKSSFLPLFMLAPLHHCHCQGWWTRR